MRVNILQIAVSERYLPGTVFDRPSEGAQFYRRDYVVKLETDELPIVVLRFDSPDATSSQVVLKSFAFKGSLPTIPEEDGTLNFFAARSDEGRKLAADLQDLIADSDFSETLLSFMQSLSDVVQ